MKTETNIHELAIRYFEGCIAQAEEKLLFDYIGQTEENRARFRQWEKEWKSTNEGDEQTMQEWQRLQCRLRTQEAVIPMLPHRHFSIWRRVAAVAVIVLLTAAGTLGIRSMVSLSSAEDFFVFEAPYGEKSKMTLADGTVVWLNAGSVLKYSDKFNERNRKVILHGEAYFEVTRKEKAEFAVQTCGYDVVVKGTKFDVSAYPEDSVVTTALLEGSVEIYRGEQRIEMKPGEMVKLDMVTGKFTRTRNDVKQWKAWSENRIEFEDITLKELVTKLSRQYDVNIRLESEQVGAKRFRISLRNRETIGEVMTALQEIIPITVERRGKDIYIRE